MKRALRIYNLLLNLYPRHFRGQFGNEMAQTFADAYADVLATQGQIGAHFWFSVIADEVPNMMQQHFAQFTETVSSRRITWGMVALAALFFVPGFFLFYGLLVQFALALPHPGLSGLAVLFAFGVLLVLPALGSGALSLLLASKLLNLFKRKSTTPVLQ